MALTLLNRATHGRTAVPRPAALCLQRRPIACRALSHSNGAEEAPQASEPPQQPADAADAGIALGRTLSELSRGNKRIAASTNLLLVGESEETWRRLDTKVNKYPMQRSFTVIGTGGPEFRESMVAAVESVVGSVHTECVSERRSSKGKYISVTVGPVWVENGDQIIRVYANLKDDGRARWII